MTGTMRTTSRIGFVWGAGLVMPFAPTFVLRVGLRLLVLVAWGLPTAVLAGEASTAVPEDYRQAPDTFPDAEVSVSYGGGNELCQALLRGYHAHGLRRFGFLGVPFPPGDPDFRLPDWQPMDPAAHLDLVKDIYLWEMADQFHALATREESRPVAWEMLRTGVIPPEVRARHWDPSVAVEVGRRVHELDLYSSRFDFDLDGKIDTVYAMTPLGRIFYNSGEPSRLAVGAFNRYSGSAKNPGLPGFKQHSLFYMPWSGYANPTHRTRGGLISGEIFFWRDGVYLFTGSSEVAEMQPAAAGWNAGLKTPYCEFVLRPKRKGDGRSP